MDARIIRGIALFALLFVSMGASYRTPNFLIKNAPTSHLAQRLGETAERHRRELSLLWTGEEMPRWSAPCPVVVTVGPHLGAGGSTTFVFDDGEVYGWQMNVQGSAQRLLDSVLPHEITHMIFASHFRRPLPRWLDEGGATSVEHVSERNNYHRMLIEFLHTNRGLPFNRMFALADYPPDAMPLYAQGHSVCDYLIRQGGHRHFVAFAEAGLNSRNWAEAVKEYYGYANLGKLQTRWVAWVGSGCPPLSDRVKNLARQREPSSEVEVIPASHLARTDAVPRPSAYLPGSTGRPVESSEARLSGPSNSGSEAPPLVPEEPRADPLPSAAKSALATSGRSSSAKNGDGLEVVSAGPMVPIETSKETLPAVEEKSVASLSGGVRSREPVATAAKSFPPSRRSTSRAQPIGKPRQQVLVEWSRF